MHSLGWDVLATDTGHIISSVLSPNIAMNYARSTGGDPIIQVKELDWLVPPISWDWSNPVAVASTTLPPSSTGTTDANLLQPPFDLIISSDTIYTSELVHSLFRTLHAAAMISGSPPVYLCIERRDPALLDRALSEAQSVWGFTTTRIPRKKISKAMEKGGLKWNKEDWDGVEIWRLKLKNV
jgi:protein N-lysine methyltransferase METTL21D